MAPSHSLTCKYQGSQKRSSSDDYCRIAEAASKSPARPLKLPSFSRQSSGSDLLTTLLFDRQRAYQKLPSTSPTPDSPPSTRRTEVQTPFTPSSDALNQTKKWQTSETQVPMAIRKKPSSSSEKPKSATRKRGISPESPKGSGKKKRIRKETPSESKGEEAPTVTSKKRAAFANTISSKVSPNTKQAGRQKALISKKKSGTRNASHSPSRTPTPPLSEDADTIATPSDNDEREANPTHLANKTPTDNPQTNPPKDQTQTLHQVRSELDAAKAEIEEQKQRREKEKKEWEAHRRQHEREAQLKVQALRHKLYDMQEKLKAATNEQTKQKDEAILRLGDATTKKNTKSADDGSTTDHEDSLLLLLRNENAKLQEENKRLKAAIATVPEAQQRLTTPQRSLSPRRAMLSPAPSSVILTEEEKTGNVRKMYVGVKLKLDNLTAAAKNVVLCTRSMVLGNFGEFGENVERLVEVMKENEQPAKA